MIKRFCYQIITIFITSKRNHDVRKQDCRIFSNVKETFNLIFHWQTLVIFAKSIFIHVKNLYQISFEMRNRTNIINWSSMIDMERSKLPNWNFLFDEGSINENRKKIQKKKNNFRTVIFLSNYFKISSKFDLLCTFRPNKDWP